MSFLLEAPAWAVSLLSELNSVSCSGIAVSLLSYVLICSGSVLVCSGGAAPAREHFVSS